MDSNFWGTMNNDFDFIQSLIREHVKGTNIEADWIDALIVGLDFLKTESADRKLAALKIVLFSELGCRFENRVFTVNLSR
jgi:hypothetical protein